MHVPAQFIQRAVQNGLAIPAEIHYASCHFSEEEVNSWTDFQSVGKLINQRLKRNEKGEYSGVFIEPGDYVSTSKFILPFDGVWLVTDGGAAREENGWIHQYHFYMAPCIRWAWDFCVIHPDDYKKCYPGMAVMDLLALRFREGQEENVPDYNMSEPWEEEYQESINPASSNTRSHYCYNRNISAPADGSIMTRDGRLRDSSFIEFLENAKHADSDDQVSFMIDHGNNEYSQIAHVLAKSLTVVPGQKVKRGQLLCRAGGRMFMPHLHWGVWDSWHPLSAQALPVTIPECMVWNNGNFVKL